MPNTTIYKVSSYVNWRLSGTGVVISGGGGSVVIPPAGLDGGGVAGQVAFWLDNDTLTGDEDFTYTVDSALGGVLGVNNIQAIGTEADVSLYILQKGAGTVFLGGSQSTGNVQIFGAQVIVQSDYIIQLNASSILIGIGTGDAPHPDTLITNAQGTGDLYIIGSSVVEGIADISAGSVHICGGNGLESDDTGGNIYLQVGDGDAGAGNVYIGTGSEGHLPPAGEADTSVVMYDPITGKLSYMAI